MKRMISDAQAPLLRAVERLFTAALTYDFERPVAIIVEAATSEDWASATYVGQRHWLELRLETVFGGDREARDSGEHASANAETHLRNVPEIDPRFRGDDGSPKCDPAPAARQSVGAALAVAAARVGAMIGEAEIEVPGHFVADIAVVASTLLDSGAVRLTLEALTLLN